MCPRAEITFPSPLTDQVPGRVFREHQRGRAKCESVFTRLSVPVRLHTVPYLTAAKSEEQAAPGESRTQVTPATEECPVTGNTKAGFTSSGLCFVWESWWPVHMVCGLGQCELLFYLPSFCRLTVSPEAGGGPDWGGGTGMEQS